MQKPVYYRDSSGMPWALWSQVLGSPEDIERSAVDLLESMLRDEHLKNPAVRIGENGRTITKKHLKDTSFLKEIATETSIEVHVEQPQQEVQIYAPTLCEFCGELVPRNGAAQFSHIKKHVNQAVKSGLLTAEEATNVKSIKLTPTVQNALKKLSEVGKS